VESTQGSKDGELDQMSADKATAWRNLQRAEWPIGNGFDAEVTLFLHTVDCTVTRKGGIKD
jgi:hypothetical protein